MGCGGWETDRRGDSSADALWVGPSAGGAGSRLSESRARPGGALRSGPAWAAPHGPRPEHPANFAGRSARRAAGGRADEAHGAGG